MDSNHMANDNIGYQQNEIQQPQKQGPVMEEAVSVTDWIIAMLIMCVPCLNIIMMFVWAFSKSEKRSKSNYFKASLIMAAIGLILTIIVTVLIVGIGFAASSM